MFAFVLVVALGAANIPPPAPPQGRSDVEKAADARDKVICKRFTETGSLVKGYRICKTKAEWEAERATTRSNMTSGGNSCGDPTRCGR